MGQVIDLSEALDRERDARQDTALREMMAAGAAVVERAALDRVAEARIVERHDGEATLEWQLTGGDDLSPAQRRRRVAIMLTKAAATLMGVADDLERDAGGPHGAA